MTGTQPHGQGSNATVTIYINAEPHIVQRGRLSFSQIVALAYPGQSGDPNLLFKVSYRLGRGHSELKTLAEGDSVQAQEGMIFNVTYENRS